MDYQLYVVRGRSTSEALRLLQGVTTVGRHDECQIRIKSSQVSRRHCELFEKKGLLLIRDLGSANGTFVNGKKIEGQRVLEPGDELTIGQVKLRVAKIGEGAPQRGAPAAPAGETAVAEAIGVIDDNEEEFEIDFDDEPEAPTQTEAPAAAAAGPKKEAPAAPKKTEPAPDPGLVIAEPESADEAIADFLLDFKIDDDD
jgi:predicted component of type VI protein secretion system